MKDYKAFLAVYKPTRATPGSGPSSLGLWLQELQTPDAASTAHCEECLRNSWNLSTKDQDTVAWVTGSAELRTWLRESRRQQPGTVLVVDSGAGRPDRLLNPLTLTVALVVQTLTAAADFPVLSFFCGLRTNDAYDEELSGPVGLLNCLNAQFLTHLRVRNPDIFLPGLDDRRFSGRSRKHVREALDLLELLVRQLSPDEDAVVVVIESACRLVGSDSKRADKAIGGILDIAERATIVFKVLITDMISNRPIEGREVTRLFVPDYIDGGRQGLNLGNLQSEATATAARFKARQDPGSSEDDGDSSSEDSDGSKDNSESSEDETDDEADSSDD